MMFLAEWYTKNAKTITLERPKVQSPKSKGAKSRAAKVGSIGFFQIGGGIAGDFPICVVPMLHQDLKRTTVPLWGYFCQISDAPTSYGGYSGATPNEKITWGKLAVNTPKYIVESNATICAPLIFAHVLGW
jgi:deoxyhypusine synthase